MTHPNAHEISRRYIAADIRSRPLPRNSIDLAGLGFVADAGEEESTDTQGINWPYVVLTGLFGWVVFLGLLRVLWGMLP